MKLSKHIKVNYYGSLYIDSKDLLKDKKIQAQIKEFAKVKVK